MPIAHIAVYLILTDQFPHQFVISSKLGFVAGRCSTI